jgi:hypothetical protein
MQEFFLDVAAFVVNSEPQTGARPLGPICVWRPSLLAVFIIFEFIFNLNWVLGWGSFPLSGRKNSLKPSNPCISLESVS